MWLNAGTTAIFTDGATAPGARSQQVKDLTNVLVDWFTNPPPQL
jgi:hypothetical protein